MTWLDRAWRQQAPPLAAGLAVCPAAGAETDFTAMTLVHAQALYRTAYHLTGNSSDAEDLAQETYLRAFRAFSGFRGGDVRAWLFLHCSPEARTCATNSPLAAV